LLFGDFWAIFCDFYGGFLMVIFEDLTFQSRSDRPDSDWTGRAKFVVADDSPIAAKIALAEWGWTPVVDPETLRLTDVIVLPEPPPPAPDSAEKAEAIRGVIAALSAEVLPAVIAFCAGKITADERAALVAADRQIHAWQGDLLELEGGDGDAITGADVKNAD
jgi:hypothetical protein